MNECVVGELTQTRRDVRSESISATCIVDLGGFKGWRRQSCGAWGGVDSRPLLVYSTDHLSCHGSIENNHKGRRSGPL